MRTTRKTEDDDELGGVRAVSDIHRRQSTVLYGRSGTGKTTLASSWPKPMLYLDVRDRGTDSINDVTELFVKDIESSEDMEDVILYLQEGRHPYKSLIIDTVSQLQEVLVEEQVEKRRRKKNSAKRAGEWGSLTQQDWGVVASKLKSWIIDLRDLDIEVVFIAQDRLSRGANDDEELADGSEVLMPEVGPRLMPSVASVLNAAVGNIGQTFIRVRHEKKEDKNGKKRYIESKDYCLRIGPSSTYVTKMRKPKGVIAPDFVIDPDYEDIIDIINGEY